MAKSKAKKRAEEEPRARHKDDHWLIVFNPWYPRHNRRGARLNHLDLDAIAWWLQFIFGPRKVQAIQYQTNQKHIIVKVDLDVEIGPKLGRYDWESFLKNASSYEQREHSKIFEYDFVKYGDQSEKGWDEYLPLSRPPPHNFEVIQPHPHPVWCERTNNWAVPIQCPVIDTPEKVHPTAALEAELPKPPLSAVEPASEFPCIRVDPSSQPPHFRPTLSSAESTSPVSRLQHEEATASTQTRDPRIRFLTPLGVRHPTMAEYRPYQTPSHHPSHSLILPVDSVNLPEVTSSISVPDNQKPIKRENSPIRVPYCLVPEEDEKKVKRDASPITVPYPEYMSDEEKVKRREPQVDAGSVQWSTPNGDSLPTRLVLIENPLGIQFPHPDSNELPEVFETWDWLQLVADGALAIYFGRESVDSRRGNWIVARIRSCVDLKGVLGRHEWGKILVHCLQERKNEVSTITPYLSDPEIEGLRRLDAPEANENYEIFCDPYPAPLPLQHSKANAAATKRKHTDEYEDRKKHKKVELHY